jgi:hypothetical protein
MHTSAGGVFCLGPRWNSKSGARTSRARLSSSQEVYPERFAGVKTGCSIAFEKKQNLSEILNRIVYADAGAGRNS